MKKDIHPKYFDKINVVCSCGAKFEVGSTLSELKVEICSACHPLYTGEKRYVDTAGRLDRFKARQERTEKLKEKLTKPSTQKQAKKEETKGKKESEE